MAYKKTNWQDTLRDAQGNVIQKGTPLNAQALGKIEDGIVQAEQKIDTEIQQVTTQLAQTKKKVIKEKDSLRKNLTVATTRKIPVVTFLDDDARNNVYYRLKPIFESRNVPLSMAVITGRFNNTSHMNLTQLRECYDLGWEVLGHTYTHPTGQQGLMQYSADYQKLEYEIGSGCKTVLEDLGFEVDGFVYPQGGQNYDIREITKKTLQLRFWRRRFQ